MNAHNEQHDPACIAAYEQLFQADSRDPSQTERLGVWATSWNAALAAQPAAAQEAVGWQWRWLDTDNTWSEWTDGGSRKEIDARIARWKADGEDHRMQVRPVFAAPVTAAPIGSDACPVTGLRFYDNMEHPERGMIAMYGGPFDVYSIPELGDDDELRRERYDLDRGDWVEGGEPLGYFYREQQLEEGSTPAAPGIDLRQFREPVTFWLERLVTHPYTEANAARLRDAKRLLAQIDASPKAALNEQFGSAEGFNVGMLVRDCCEAERADPDHPFTICISVNALTEIARRHALADSPKGGSEARDALRVAYRHLDVDALRVSHRNDLAIIESAMHPQAGDAEVQP